MSSKSSHDVGYCKPPRARQWKKGQSGNPRGRPRRPRRPPPEDMIDWLADALLEDRQVELDGQECTVPQFELWCLKLIRDSFHESVKVRLLVLACFQKVGVFGRLQDRMCAQVDSEEQVITDEDRALLKQIELQIEARQPTDV